MSWGWMGGGRAGGRLDWCLGSVGLHRPASVCGLHCCIIPIQILLALPPLFCCRLSDMELVRVLPSADDEINAACFHPRAGGGVAYGTKEGRLRIISHDRSHL